MTTTFRRTLASAAAATALLASFALPSYAQTAAAAAPAAAATTTAPKPDRAMHKHGDRSEEHTSELQSHSDLVCRLLLENKKKVREHELPLLQRFSSAFFFFF